MSVINMYNRCIHTHINSRYHTMLTSVKIWFLQITLQKLGSHKNKSAQFSYRLLEKTFINK